MSCETWNTHLWMYTDGLHILECLTWPKQPAQKWNSHVACVCDCTIIEVYLQYVMRSQLYMHKAHLNVMATRSTQETWIYVVKVVVSFIKPAPHKGRVVDSAWVCSVQILSNIAEGVLWWSSATVASKDTSFCVVLSYASKLRTPDLPVWRAIVIYIPISFHPLATSARISLDYFE